MTFKVISTLTGETIASARCQESRVVSIIWWLAF